MTCNAHALVPSAAPPYWPRACEELSSRCSVMASLITAYPGQSIQSRGQPFETLFRSIVGQQISVRAAQCLWDRVRQQLLQPQDPLYVWSLNTAVLRSLGLSTRKVEYIKDLAAHFVDGRINPARWQTMTDEEIIQELTQVRGVGRWTAEMLLMFTLLRPNVFPKADLGMQKAISVHYGKRYPLSPRQLELMRKKFTPWSSVAVWYLWRSLDPIPVEY